MTHEEQQEVETRTLKSILRQRGIQFAEDVCPSCRGLGARAYGSGSTWRGGMGTASIEHDVCDKCWGSGDTSRPWTDIRKLEEEEGERVERRAKRLFAEACGNDGITNEGWQEAQRIIRDAIARLPNKRGLSFWTRNGLEAICGRLCELLSGR